MKYNVLLFKISIIAVGILIPSVAIFNYFPYFGLWNESKIFENLDELEILSRAEQLQETTLFLEKYPDAQTEILWERGQILYLQEQTVKTEYGDEKRKLNMQIKFDVFGNPSPYLIGCSGENVSIGGFTDVLEKLEFDWCFDGEIISIEYRK
ncbi:MAG: hypothetical protein K5798_10875 [Nitrosopumilus sp.]|uniref:hypothetical protein n=1 Tax=Nitrosopumilus sp. TaxID=2024843 RepID=UPI002432DED3|nr:hypothetical protein [Nitrosopumilus sp.]MCV0367749.1 hypothetical protein [Nitrosopumilus sp.]